MMRNAVYVASIMIVMLFATTTYGLDESALKESWNYYESFLEQTADDIKTIVEAEDQAVLALRDVNGGKIDYDSVFRVSSGVWQLRAAVELAQDVLLASTVEMAIAQKSGREVVVYEDALRRFPKPTVELAQRVAKEFADAKEPSMVAAWQQVKPALDRLVTTLDEWPGTQLERVLKSGQRGVASLPSDVVVLGGSVDKVHQEVQAFERALGCEVDKYRATHLMYAYNLQQCIRNVGILAAVSQGMYVLVGAKKRLASVSVEAGRRACGEEYVDYYLSGRQKWRDFVLDKMRNQCVSLENEDKTACIGMIKTFEVLSGEIKQCLAE